MLKPGMKGTIYYFSDEQVGSRLLTMGILPGSNIEVVRKAPLGGGIFVKVDGNYLALRKQEAASIILR